MFSPSELFDIVAMSLILGFIFSDVFKKPITGEYDPLKAAQKGFNWANYQFAIAVTAPAVILHEFGHKFVALGFGMQATFEAAYQFLALGVVMKLLSFPFVFFVPAYVSITGFGTPWQFMLVAFAGPAVNLVIWLGSKWYVQVGKAPKKYVPFLLLTSKVNMFLFVFNMLPIPGFDGSKIFFPLFEMVAGFF